MKTEVIELSGDLVGLDYPGLHNKIREYQGVRDVSTVPAGRGVILVVEYDDTCAGEFDDSAVQILRDDMGIQNAAAKFLKPPPWQVNAPCQDEKHSDCNGAIQSEFWQTSLVCQCECHTPEMAAEYLSGE